MLDSNSYTVVAGSMAGCSHEVDYKYNCIHSNGCGVFGGDGRDDGGHGRDHDDLCLLALKWALLS